MAHLHGEWGNKDPLGDAQFLERTAVSSYHAFWRIAQRAGRASCNVVPRPGSRTITEMFHPVVVKEVIVGEGGSEREATKVYLLGEIREIPDRPSRAVTEVPITVRQTMTVRERVFDDELGFNGEEFDEAEFVGVLLSTRSVPGSESREAELAGDVVDWIPIPDSLLTHQVQFQTALQELGEKIGV